MEKIEALIARINVLEGEVKVWKSTSNSYQSKLSEVQKLANYWEKRCKRLERNASKVSGDYAKLRG
jgi:chromosome segregation ATPase